MTTPQAGKDRDKEIDEAARECIGLWAVLNERAGHLLAEDVTRLTNLVAALVRREVENAHTHRQDALIRRDGMMCEKHPGLPFMHDEECPGPGMPWIIEGRADIEAAVEQAVAKEREGCARTVEKLYRSEAGYGQLDAEGQRRECRRRCAAAIRARGQEGK